MKQLLVALFVLSSSLALAESDERDDDAPFSRGFGFVGAFFVTQIDTTASIFSTEVPIGARINFNTDLGLRDRQTVPRGAVGWRFGKRHLISAGYYDLSLDGIEVLNETIELPPDFEFEIGATVTTSFETRILKTQYTWLFHSDPKVSLGISAGLFTADIGATLQSSTTLGLPVTEQRFDESLQAPLPVLGGRLTYALTKKLALLATADWFFVDYDDYRGVLGDFQIFVTHRTSKHIGFAAGLNIQSIRVDIEEPDEKLLWELDESLVGFLAALAFYF